jgi:predicted acyltransferase (DUF342 family)
LQLQLGFFYAQKIEKHGQVFYTYMYKRSYIMDYRFLTQKTLSLINTSFILLFFSTNISAFETNSDSKITANLEVTGALKLGSVDSSSDGIITSITDSSDSTVPTAGAVKDYVDTRLGSNPDSINITNMELSGALKLEAVDASSNGIVTSISDSSNSTIPTTAAVKAYVDTQIADNPAGDAAKNYVDSRFGTDPDSIVTTNMELSGALKLESVDASSNGIVTSITDSSNSTIPTTGAVKAYVDTQLVTNPDSIIATTVEATGALKFGWVDSSSSGIVTTISNSSNSTIPTTGAVKAYLDAQVAGSSGGYPSEVGYWGDAGNFSLNYCRDKGAGWRIPSVNEVLNVVPANTTDRYIWTTNPGFAADQYIAVKVTDGRFASLNVIGGLAPDGWNGYYVCVR